LPLAVSSRYRPSPCPCGMAQPGCRIRATAVLKPQICERTSHSAQQSRAQHAVPIRVVCRSITALPRTGHSSDVQNQGIGSIYMIRKGTSSFFPIPRLSITSTRGVRATIDEPRWRCCLWLW
jgi:hypothetical protein